MKVNEIYKRLKEIDPEMADRFCMIEVKTKITPEMLCSDNEANIEAVKKGLAFKLAAVMMSGGFVDVATRNMKSRKGEHYCILTMSAVAVGLQSTDQSEKQEQ